MSRAARRVRSARRATGPAGLQPLPLRRERLLSALETISPDERLVLALLVYEGLSTDEVAGLLDIPARTVEATCGRLMIELRRAVAGRPMDRRVAAGAERLERAALRRAV